MWLVAAEVTSIRQAVSSSFLPCLGWCLRLPGSAARPMLHQAQGQGTRLGRGERAFSVGSSPSLPDAWHTQHRGTVCRPCPGTEGLSTALSPLTAAEAGPAELCTLPTGDGGSKRKVLPCPQSGKGGLGLELISRVSLTLLATCRSTWGTSYTGWGSPRLRRALSQRMLRAPIRKTSSSQNRQLQWLCSEGSRLP